MSCKFSDKILHPLIKPAIQYYMFPVFCIGTDYDHPSPSPIFDKRNISGSFGKLVIL